MSKICLIVFIFFIGNAFAQETMYAVTSKKSHDTLWIKWIPKDIVSLQALLNEKTDIFYVACDKNTSLNSVVFPSAPVVTKTPMKDRIEKFTADNPEVLNFSEAFLNVSGIDSMALGMSFSNAIIQNLINKKIAELTGNVLSIPKFNKSKKYAIRLKNKAFSKDFTFFVDPSEKQITEIETSNISVTQKKVLYQWSVEGLSNSFCAYNIYKRSSKERNFTKLNAQPIMPFVTSAELNPNMKERVDNAIVQGETYYYQSKGIDFFGDETGESEIKKIYIPLEVNGVVQFDSLYADLKTRERIFKGSFVSNDTVHPLHVSEVVLLRSDSLFIGYQEVQRLKIKFTDIPFQFIIPNVKSGERFFYKFVALSPDNDSSETVGRYLFTYDQDPPDVVTELKGTIDSLGIMRLSWKAPIDKDIQGYRIFRGNQKSEDFGEVFSELIKETQIMDTLPLNTLTNEIYYYVRVVDENYNNSACSDTVLLLKPDTIPPSAGVFMPHTYSEKGVKLFWNNCKANDLKAQYIVRKDETTAETNIFTWNDTVQKEFLDTTVQSGKHYTYTLIAEDKSLNKGFSETYGVNFELGYRDAIKSLKYVIDREKKCVVLSWNYDPKEVYTFQIYKCKADGPWRLYKTIDGKAKQELVDTQLTINTVFKYKIVAMLNSGISTKMSIPVEVLY